MVEQRPVHLLSLYVALTCPSCEDWMDLMEEVLERYQGKPSRIHNQMWEDLLDHLVANVGEA